MTLNPPLQPDGVQWRRRFTDRNVGAVDRPAPRFSVVVPCFNEEGGIRKTIAQLRESLNGLQPYELIIVDDGSTDGTRTFLLEEKTTDLELRILTHREIQGYGAAL